MEYYKDEVSLLFDLDKLTIQIHIHINYRVNVNQHLVFLRWPEQGHILQFTGLWLRYIYIYIDSNDNIIAFCGPLFSENINKRGDNGWKKVPFPPHQTLLNIHNVLIRCTESYAPVVHIILQERIYSTFWFHGYERPYSDHTSMYQLPLFLSWHGQFKNGQNRTKPKYKASQTENCFMCGQTSEMTQDHPLSRYEAMKVTLVRIKT